MCRAHVRAPIVNETFDHKIICRRMFSLFLFDICDLPSLIREGHKVDVRFYATAFCCISARTCNDLALELLSIESDARRMTGRNSANAVHINRKN